MRILVIDHKKTEHPTIKLTVKRVESTTFYSLGFHKHHYLIEEINSSCKCLLFEWNNNPVAFVGILNTPRKNRPMSMAISRIVILPEYQGLGLFRRICNFCGGIVKSLSTDDAQADLYIKTIHQKAGMSLTRDIENWEATSYDQKTRLNTVYEAGKYNNRKNRVSYCKKYIGKVINGYEDILLPINEMRKKKILSNSKQLTLF